MNILRIREHKRESTEGYKPHVKSWFIIQKFKRFFYWSWWSDLTRYSNGEDISYIFDNKEDAELTLDYLDNGGEGRHPILRRRSYYDIRTRTGGSHESAKEHADHMFNEYCRPDYSIRSIEVSGIDKITNYNIK